MARAYKKYPFDSLSTMQDPIPLWKEMLADGDVVRSRIFLVKELWVANSWDAASEVLRDQERFGRDPKRAGKSQVPGMKWWMPRRFSRLANNMLAYDKEQHRRLRSIVDQAFLRSEIELLKPKISLLADQYIDRFEEHITKSPEHAGDLVSTFCRALPLAVICEVMGIPDEDRAKFKDWFRAFAEVSSFWGLFRIMPGVGKLLRYLDKKFEELRQEPKPGLLSELVQIEMDGERLTKDELVSTVFILLIAGHETTVHLLSNGVLQLLNSPDQRKLLEEDWSLAGGAVDEVLRWAAPVQFSKPRFVIEDMEFHGKQLKRGEYIISALACANMDPNKFVEPEKFDILRTQNPHLTFGSGVHVCLGLKLAKAEAEIAFERLFTRFPGLRLAESRPRNEPVVWSKRLGLRSIKRLNLAIS